jgi:thiol-disulfide isomerase/thioredoxin
MDLKARWLRSSVIGLLLVALLWLGGGPPARATLNDDHYDGNIFALYGGNGSLVPPRVTLSQSLQLARPALLVFYADDSADCKRFTPVLNQMQAFYRRQLSLIPIAIDSLTPETDATRFYRGFIPQTVLVDATGKVVFDRVGAVSLESLDGAVRQVLGLPDSNPELRPRSGSQINEINP